MLAACRLPDRAAPSAPHSARAAAEVAVAVAVRMRRPPELLLPPSAALRLRAEGAVAGLHTPVGEPWAAAVVAVLITNSLQLAGPAVQSLSGLIPHRLRRDLLG